MVSNDDISFKYDIKFDLISFFTNLLKVNFIILSYREIKHHQEFVFFERPRNVMSPLMRKTYPSGCTYFVTQRRPSTVSNEEQESGFMRTTRLSSDENRPPVNKRHSRRTSFSSSVVSDHNIYPEPLRKQLDALDMLNRYENGRAFSLPDKQNLT